MHKVSISDKRFITSLEHCQLFVQNVLKV